MKLQAPCLAATAILLALWAPAEDARAQAQTPPEAQGLETDISPIAALEGAWVRNAEVSEDPIQKTLNLWREPEQVSSTMLGLSTSLAARMGRLLIHVEAERVRLRNAEYEILEFPTNGSTVADRYGNRHRASVSPGTLEIETLRPGWLLVETLYLQGERLLRVIEVQTEQFPSLRFLTVYEYAGNEPRSTPPIVGDGDRFARPAAIRIVPPERGHRELLAGRVEVGTLIVDPTIGAVEFFVDSRRRKRVTKPPFEGRITLADPPREQTLEVRAYSDRGAYVGDDRVVLNRFDPPFAVRIGAITPRESDRTLVHVETRIAVPRGAALERVEFYRGERLVETVGNLTPHTGTGGFRSVAGEVPLVLGMAIDSSASMKPVWSQLRTVAGAFLQSSLAADDRAFLVDFDDTIRLLQPPTGNTPALAGRLDRLVPQGGTALNDGVLFSLLQYRSEPGRRALIVVTDGIDLGSRSDPEQAAAFAERSGIPIYFIDLGRDQIALLDTGTLDKEGKRTKQTRAARSSSDRLRMRGIAQRSGGRLFQIDLDLSAPEFSDAVHEVFERIEEDLRHQYVLTYYSDRPLGAAIEPEVRTTRKNLEVRSVLPLYAADEK